MSNFVHTDRYNGFGWEGYTHCATTAKDVEGNYPNRKFELVVQLRNYGRTLVFMKCMRYTGIHTGLYYIGAQYH